MTPAMYAGVVAMVLGAVFYLIALFKMGDRGADGWLALGIACMVGGFIVLVFSAVSHTNEERTACREKGGVLVKEVCIERNVVIK